MRIKDEQLHQRINQAKNEPLPNGMQVFMLFEVVVCVHRRGVGSAKKWMPLKRNASFYVIWGCGMCSHTRCWECKKMNLSQAECKCSCYLRLWYVFPHEVLQCKTQWNMFRWWVEGSCYVACNFTWGFCSRRRPRFCRIWFRPTPRNNRGRFAEGFSGRGCFV